MTQQHPGPTADTNTNTGTGTNTHLRRALSPVERWYWTADRTSPLSGLVRTRVHGDLPPELLRRALDVLQARHPLLRVAITGDENGERPAFRPVDTPIPLRHVEVAPDDPEADSRWERETNEHEFAEHLDWHTGPLLRATLITRAAGAGHPEAVHDLLLAASHCVADGMTGLSLLTELLTIAAQLAAGGQPTRASRPALAAAEDLLPARHRGPEGAAALGELLRLDEQEARRLRPRRILPSRAVPFAQRRTRMVHRSLTADQLERLTRACKQHGTTVHGALAAAMVTAVAHEAETAETAYFSIGSPVDFRRELETAVSYEDAGSYASTLASRVRYEPGAGLWPMARAVGQDLADRRKREEHLTMLTLWDRSGPKTFAEGEAFMRHMDEQGPLNLCLSNIDRYDVPDRLGPWRVSDTQLVAAISVTGAVVATANTSHGGLAWNFSHVDGLVPAPRARYLADESLRVLLDAVSG
ncbi:condensation domain-containing protein [Streptomyces sp. UNOC14_S4]|uniref:phthiocerol/phthiodiolone dimycocerosyl transferase family protein n=1 Tax=Streptomyces sp. UNOC14_S4 TaxID=2872340 RepID=UPI001E5EB1D8|nr:condensation domain-containing protein [Streptomyces sp. UNOC14_S4]